MWFRCHQELAVCVSGEHPLIKIFYSRDVTLVDNTPIDYLDFASPQSGLGGKIGLDATGKLPSETRREWGRPIRMTDETIAEVTKKWGSYGLPGAGKPIWK